MKAFNEEEFISEVEGIEVPEGALYSAEIRAIGNAAMNEPEDYLFKAIDLAFKLGYERGARQ